MELEYKGGNCVVLSAKKTVLVIDAKLSDLGLKDFNGFNIQIATQPKFAAVSKTDALTIEMPGEYEVANCSVRGIAAQRHTDTKEEGLNTTIYTVEVAGVKLCIVGHVVAPLTDDQLEAINVVDIVVLPVGGNGYTLDAHEAVKVVRQLSPKVVVPTHYADKALKYEVEQNGLEEFTKELAAPVEVVDKLKIKNGILPDGITVFEIKRS